MKKPPQQQADVQPKTAPGEPAALRSRAQLKELFKNGKQPVEGDFADLIDAFVHQDDIPELFDLRQPEQPPPQPQPQPHIPNGWQGAGGRIGLYDTLRGPEQLPRAQSLVRAQVPADGRWHTILSGLNDCYAFEIVASASGKVGSMPKAYGRPPVIAAGTGGGASDWPGVGTATTTICACAPDAASASTKKAIP